MIILSKGDWWQQRFGFLIIILGECMLWQSAMHHIATHTLVAHGSSSAQCLQSQQVCKVTTNSCLLRRLFHLCSHWELLFSRRIYLEDDVRGVCPIRKRRLRCVSRTFLANLHALPGLTILVQKASLHVTQRHCDLRTDVLRGRSWHLQTL